MKVVLIDDELSMLLIMKKMLSRVPEVEIAGAFQSTHEAYRFMKENKPDIAFIDIKMPEESGLDFARKMAEDLKGVDIVFLTSYKQYALDAYDVDALDYIVKPVTRERLERAISKVMQRRLPPEPERQEEAFSAKLRIFCLGCLDIKGDDKSPIELSSSKSAELLAYLLMNRGNFVSKWNVLEDVFGEMPLPNAETYLNTTVYKLRKALEPCGMKEAVITANESYRLDIKDIYVDFIEFENKVNRLSLINESCMAEALETEKLFTGQLFGDKEYQWSTHERERLTDLYWDYGKKLGCCLLNNNNMAASLQIFKKMARLNPLDEEINCLLMQAYAAKKDHVSLIRQYKRYARLLKSELEVSPGRKASDLYTKLVKSLE